MAIRLREHPDSRELNFGSQGGGQTFHVTAVTTAGESETTVWLYVMSQSTPYYNGFVRQSIVVKPIAGPLFDVVIAYGTAGVGGGDQPVGGIAGDGSPPIEPTAPSGSTPVISGYSFSITAPRIHFTQSLDTISKTKRGGGDADDHKGAIGIDLDKKPQGVDWPPEAAFTFTRTWGLATVTTSYFNTLAQIAGRTNNATFYGFAAGEVLFQSATGNYTQGEGWSMSASFGVSKNVVNLAICDGLTVPAKGGWEYVWVEYESIDDGGKKVTVPRAAYVEKIINPAAFGLIGIGA